MSTETPGFTGHETFPFRYGWLKKGVDALAERPKIFTAKDATTRLGVGKNMVRSIKHWCLATGLIEEQVIPGQRQRPLVVSSLGKSIVGEGGHDPYLEDPATLWLLHYQLASRPGRAHTWFWTFNHYRKRQFSRVEVRNEIAAIAKSFPNCRASANTVKRDVDCFIRSYVPSKLKKGGVIEDTLDCPLVELGLLTELADHDTFAFNGGERSSLSQQLFVYCLQVFWNQQDSNQNTLRYESLAYEPGSPGKVFKMSDNELVGRLESIEKHTRGALAYDDTAGLKQLYRRENLELRELLAEIYGTGRLALA